MKGNLKQLDDPAMVKGERQVKGKQAKSQEELGTPISGLVREFPAVVLVWSVP